jgi:hypothetical protein
MANLWSVPANRKVAYLCDMNGDNVFAFMFAPHELDFTEENDFFENIPVGSTEPDVLWVGGVPKRFPLEIFVDRTNESGGTNTELDAFYQENVNQSFSSQLAERLARTIGRITDAANADIATFSSAPTGQKFNFVRSDLNISPQYSQDGYDNETIGVYPDLDRLLYYIRQAGENADSVSIDEGATIEQINSQINKFSNPSVKKFVSPPKCRFFYGTLWREGYVRKLDYKLEVPNAQLIPRRLRAKLEFLWIRGGSLSPVAPAQSTTNVGSTNMV